jgi:hypothetical protein
VVAVALALVVVGTLGGWAYLEESDHSSQTPSILDDGPSFYQALASLNSSVTNESGGPWSIFSVMGIAAQQAYSPSVKGYNSFNASPPVNGCQAVLNGLTMFNGSIPTFNGTFNSGTAPFWQFAYYSSTTAEVLVGTNVLGTPHLFAPFPLSSNCTQAWGDFSLDPTYWADQVYSNSSLPANSPIAARVVWGNVDTGYLDSHQPLVELFTSGPAMLAATQSLPYGILGVDFVSCGLAGFTGYTTDWPAGYGMAYYSGTNKNGSWSGIFNASTNCFLGSTATVAGAVTGSYQLQFVNTSTSSGANTAWVGSTTMVNFASTGGSNYTDMWGLANWMVSLNVTNSTGQLLTPGASGCPDWVSSISDCHANSSGWYVVLLSANGEWLASYGAVAGGGTNWTVPVMAMVSYQHLVVVVPRSWLVSGYVLNVMSSTAYATITGSVSL